MPRVLELTEVDAAAEELDTEITAEEEANERNRYNQEAPVGDLTYGGTAFGVNVRPNRDKRNPHPRAVARRAWMWDGTETLLPLAWDPDGKIHDGARRYMAKRHCLCCRFAGFKSLQCPKCADGRCSLCNSSTDPSKVIRCFYFSKDKVPFPAKFYGSINCFLEVCPRRGGRGFLSEEEMRLHARSTHRMQYQAHLETLAASEKSEVEVLKARLDTLMGNMLYQAQSAPAPVAVAEPEEAPLYVPDPKPPKKWGRKPKS